MMWSCSSLAEESQATLSIEVTKEQLSPAEPFVLYANLTEQGNISIEIDDPDDDVVYLRTVETNRSGRAVIQLKAGRNWSAGQYMVYASARTSEGMRADTVHFSLVLPLPNRYPDFTVGSSDIWLSCVGDGKNVSLEHGGGTLNWTEDSTEQVFVNVRIKNTGDIRGDGVLTIYMNKRNQSNRVGTQSISLSSDASDVFSFPLSRRFLPEETNDLLVLAFVENVSPKEKNPLDNQMARDFTIIIVTEDDTQDGTITILPETPYVVMVYGSIAGVGLCLFVGGTDIGRYSFFSLLLPLYTRLKKGDVRKEIEDDKFVRGQIYGYIKVHQGTNYTQIKTALDIGNGTLYYHLKVLEREHFIKSKIDGINKRFFLWEEKIFLDGFQPSGLEKKIIHFILEQNERGTVTQTDIKENFAITKQRVSRIVKKLRKKRILKTGKFLQLTDEASLHIDEFLGEEK